MGKHSTKHRARGHESPGRRYRRSSEHGSNRGCSLDADDESLKASNDVSGDCAIIQPAEKRGEIESAHPSQINSSERGVDIPAGAQIMVRIDELSQIIAALTTFRQRRSTHMSGSAVIVAILLYNTEITSVLHAGACVVAIVPLPKSRCGEIDFKSGFKSASIFGFTMLEVECRFGRLVTHLTSAWVAF